MKLILSDRPLPLPDLGPEVRFVDLSALRIAPCTGCFGCWTRTPGRCVIRDDATAVYPLIARSEAVFYISRLVGRNAANMNFAGYRVLFAREADLEQTVQREVTAWLAS